MPVSFAPRPPKKRTYAISIFSINPFIFLRFLTLFHFEISFFFSFFIFLDQHLFHWNEMKKAK
jgi:hypothetical protein